LRYLLLQSYYGAALCVCWSPDAALLASGGEDDLVTVYSIADRQVSNSLKRFLLGLCVCRCFPVLCLTSDPLPNVVARWLQNATCSKCDLAVFFCGSCLLGAVPGNHMSGGEDETWFYSDATMQIDMFWISW
jgi:hypothetical protein